MIPAERKEQILNILQDKGFLSVEELAGTLYVSAPTIRRDLCVLEKEGVLRRTHGGAAYIEQGFMAGPFTLRNKTNLDEKLKIGNLAAQLVHDGDSIFIYTSSTCLCFAKALNPLLKLNVLTNGIPIAQTLAEHENMTVECPAGLYNAKHASIYGSEACDFIERRHAKYLFVSCTGIDTHTGATIQQREDLAVMKAFRKNAGKVVMLIDHTKFNISHYYCAFTLDEIDIIISDQPLPEDLQKICNEKGIEVLV